MEPVRKRSVLDDILDDLGWESGNMNYQQFLNDVNFDPSNFSYIDSDLRSGCRSMIYNIQMDESVYSNIVQYGFVSIHNVLYFFIKKFVTDLNQNRNHGWDSFAIHVMTVNILTYVTTGDVIIR